MTQKSRKRFKYFENEKSFQESFFIIFKWLPKTASGFRERP